MFIRQCFRTVEGKRRAYWALVESVRTDRGPRQNVVAWLGALDEAGRLGVQQAARSQVDNRADAGVRSSSPQLALFEFEDEPAEPRWVRVNTSAVRVENSRAFGGPWLAMHLLEQLKLDEFLHKQMPLGRESVQWSVTAMILVIARLLDPSSELYVSEQWYPKTALPDLLGVPVDRIDDNRLYRALDELLPHKEALEVHLKNRLGELFDLEYDLLLYDVTSTFFEGQCASNPLAQRGYSRDQRGDCKQVCIALVVSRCGMPVGYEVFAGNTADVTTVKGIVELMESRYGKSDWHELSDGCYLLRTNVSDWTDEQLWKAYIQLTEAENAFRIHKSDLSLRPVWHQKEDRVRAHILVCFLSYVLWKTLGQMCKRAGLGDEPRRVLAELSDIRMVDVVLPTDTGHEIRNRCVARPSEHQRILLDKLRLKLPTRIRIGKM